MRREILKLSAGWVLCAAAFVACGGEQIRTVKGLGFQITLPGETGIGDGVPQFCALVHLKDKRTAVVRLEVTDLKEGDSLRSFFKIPRYQDHLKNAILTAIDVVKIDGRSTLKLSTSVGQFQRVIYYAVANGRGYALLIHAQQVDFDKYAKDIDAIVASFKIIEAK